MMNRPLENEYNPNYQKYFDLVSKGNYFEILKQNKLTIIDFFENIPLERHNFKYAPDKWSIKSLLMHIIDTERVFSNRGLMAARGDANTLVQRMDEELYAGNVNVDKRTMQNLLEEFSIVRDSTEILFKNFSEAQCKLWCNINPYPMTARAIGYFIIGHSNYHLNIINERYLNKSSH